MFFAGAIAAQVAALNAMTDWLTQKTGLTLVCGECGKPIVLSEPMYYRHQTPYHSTCGDPLGIKAAVAAERERCAKLVQARADMWNEHAKIGRSGDCSESLADECEDIVAAIRRGEQPSSTGGER